MNTLIKLKPADVAERVNSGGAVLIDIRDTDEYESEHIAGAILSPLSALDEKPLAHQSERQVIFHCRTGARTEKNCERLLACVEGEAFVLDGGLNAWKEAGLPTTKGAFIPIQNNQRAG